MSALEARVVLSGCPIRVNVAFQGHFRGNFFRIGTNVNFDPRMNILHICCWMSRAKFPSYYSAEILFCNSIPFDRRRRGDYWMDPLCCWVVARIQNSLLLRSIIGIWSIEVLHKLTGSAVIEPCDGSFFFLDLFHVSFWRSLLLVDFWCLFICSYFSTIKLLFVCFNNQCFLVACSSHVAHWQVVLVVLNCLVL